MSTRGYFGIGVWKPKTENNIGTLWRAAHIFGASFIFVIGARYKKQTSDTSDVSKHVPLYEYNTFEDFYNFKPKDCPLVALETVNSTPIKNFIHPERCCYILGAEDHGLSQNILNKCNHIVYLPGKFCLNVAVAGSILMFDRINKANVTNFEAFIS